MESVRKSLRHIIIWAHGRGTLQYDIICALILAFIFFVPRSCFVPDKAAGTTPILKKAPSIVQPTPKNDEKPSK
jgi:hypothetical protein